MNKLENVRILIKAVWDTSNQILSIKKNTIGTKIMYYGSIQVCQTKNVESQTVTSIRLDDIDLDYSKIDLIKIDTEGSEYEILMGGENTFQKTAAIYIECNKENLKKTLYILKEQGFSCKILPVQHATHVFATRK